MNKCLESKNDNLVKYQFLVFYEEEPKSISEVKANTLNKSEVKRNQKYKKTETTLDQRMRFENRR